MQRYAQGLAAQEATPAALSGVERAQEPQQQAAPRLGPFASVAQVRRGAAGPRPPS